ncbi:unnamed protein product [Rotaria sp. Silwood1]|nr:unnamed protein product [Rotaria sp. Silwood1]
MHLTTNISSKMSQQQRQHMAENYLVIWVDGNIDMANEDCQNTLTQLRGAVNQVNLCTTIEECIQQLNENPDLMSFVISSGTLGQHLVPNIHEIQKLKSIYIFCRNKKEHQVWAHNWRKVKGVHTNIKHICDKMITAIKRCNEDNITVGIVGENEVRSSENLDQLDSTFMYSQIFKEILLEIKHGEQAIKDMVTYCQEVYCGNDNEIKIIDEFKHNYQASKAIWWYTRQCFTYKMLNGALRTLNGDIMIRLDDDQQLAQLADRIRQEVDGSGWYRMEQRPNDSDKARIYNMLGEVKTNQGQYNEANSFYEAALESCCKIVPKDASTLAEIYKNIGGVQHIMGNYSEALQYFEKALEIRETVLPLSHPDLAQIYAWMGATYSNTGYYAKALEFHKKAYKIYRETLPLNHPDMSISYSSIGGVYNSMGDYTKALEFYEKANQIYEKALPPNHPDLAASYSTVGQMFTKMGSYSKALAFYKKAHEIYEKALSSNHPDLASS